MPADKPNIVIILADDTGYGDLSCYGHQTISTPNIDQLAAEGVRFTDPHSNGAVCSLTRAAFVTGRYQQRCGIEGVITAAGHRRCSPSTHDLALSILPHSRGPRNSAARYTTC
jgi:arylsulfatase A-like enzyme